jgi:RHS repeat-associated protein
VAKFRYDGLTRRITKETPAQTRSYYFNDQWRALEERISGTVNKDYLWNPADRWNLIQYRYTPSGNGPPTQTRYVLKDGLDPVAVIDDTGTVKERARYEAFGSVTFMNASFGSPSSTSSEEWNFLFHGEILDGETGLYNYGYRQYHPELGRWPSRDPIGEVGGVNLYGMIGNDAINSWDLLGLERIDGALIGRAAADGKDDLCCAVATNEWKTHGSYADCILSCIGDVLGAESSAASLIAGIAANAKNIPAPQVWAAISTALGGYSLGVAIGCKFACESDVCMTIKSPLFAGSRSTWFGLSSEQCWVCQETDDQRD